MGNIWHVAWPSKILDSLLGVSQSHPSKGQCLVPIIVAVFVATEEDCYRCSSGVVNHLHAVVSCAAVTLERLGQIDKLAL